MDSPLFVTNETDELLLDADSDEATFAEVGEVLDSYITDGPHPEYRAFEYSLGPTRRRAFSVWDFVYDAVHGTGGFADGRYLFPNDYEVDSVGQITKKLKDRREQADYDAFAAKVCNAAFDMITAAKDLIRRESTDPRLSDFWSNCDGHGTHIFDFLEYPFRQARMYGTGWIIVDRPNISLRTAADDANESNRPYVYALPTRNVVYWEFDDDGLCALVILEPASYDITSGGDLVESPSSASPIRVWTRNYWALFAAHANAKTATIADYDLIDSGVNALGEVPAVMVFNEQPQPGRALGTSEMLNVARLAQTVYQMDSERRETERKCNLQMAIPVKDITSGYDQKQVLLGPDTVLVYDGDAGEPRYIAPNLDILTKLKESRDSKVQQAFDMASLRPLVGTVKSPGTLEATSGLHAQVELFKTEQRIAKHAASLELAEMRISYLVLRYFGAITGDVSTAPTFTILYPRKFGIEDVEKVTAQTATIIELGLGDAFNRKAIYTLAKALWPRTPDEEVNQMVEQAVVTLAKERASEAVSQQDTKSRVQGLVAKMTGQVLNQGLKSSNG